MNEARGAPPSVYVTRTSNNAPTCSCQTPLVPRSSLSPGSPVVTVASFTMGSLMTWVKGMLDSEISPTTITFGRLITKIIILIIHKASGVIDIREPFLMSRFFHPNAKSYHHPNAKSYHHPNAKSYHHPNAKSYHHPNAKSYHHPNAKSYHHPNAKSYHHPNAKSYHHPNAKSYHHPNAKSYHHPNAKSYHHPNAKSYHHPNAKSYHHPNAKSYHHPNPSPTIILMPSPTIITSSFHLLITYMRIKYRGLMVKESGKLNIVLLLH
ncbi:hypothetical protein EMCRGX_G018963 [Ephydatia muelleri]